MDSYTLIKKLRNTRREFELSAGAQALFYELIAINNEKKWSETFKCRNNELEGALELSEKTLIAYRRQLLKAGLITFKSGKKKHSPSEYSLCDYTFNDTCDDTNDCKNYSQNEEKITDHLKHIKQETKTIDDGDVDSARRYSEEEREELINHFRGYDEEKEKSSAKKEKRVLPGFETIAEKLTDFEYWRIALEHHCLPNGIKWEKLILAQQMVYEQQRLDYFKIFYEQQLDCYRARGMPSLASMVNHFYNWLPIHKTKADRLKLEEIANGNTKTNSGYNSAGKNRSEANAGRKAMADRATEALQAIGESVG